MDGIHRIAVERLRQIEDEGYTAEHDQEHHNSALAWAAVCYAAPQEIFYVSEEPHRDPDGVMVRSLRWWEPWPKNWRRRPMPHSSTRTSRIEDLTKAGALIAAEIDRLLAVEGGALEGEGPNGASIVPPPCEDHHEVQHRDHKPPWCNSCGWRHGRPAQPPMQIRERD